jgi:hypothetical protein
MLKNQFFLMVFGATLILGSVVQGYDVASDPALLGWWSCDEGQGATVADISGNGNDGTFVNGDPAWAVGVRGSAVQLVGPTLVEIPPMDLVLTESTMAGWILPNGSQPDWSSFLMHRSPGPANGFNILGYQLAYHWNGTQSSWSYRGGDMIAQNEWTFAAISIVPDSATFYINGVEGSTNTVAHDSCIWDGVITLGGDPTTGFVGRRMNGALDDVAFFSRALSGDEIMALMEGFSNPALAGGANPAKEAIDVARDTSLSWSAGKYAAKHTVYFGTSLEDVNNADPRAIVSQGQTGTEYTPANVLAFGETYYWRVDEVNAPPTNTVYAGKVWSFSVEPMAIPVENITATASGSNLSMEPEKTIDGSGLNAMDQHSTDPTTMWLALGTPWIQYEFDKAYKLHELLVWNSNQVIEAFIGFGVKELTIETSLDGENWSALGGPVEIDKAPGAATYDGAAPVDMGGTMAKFVKLTVGSAHGLTGQAGLAEVRFMAIPVAAREPQPQDGSTTASSDVELSWRAGREAVSHQVYLGTDADSMTLIDTTNDAKTATDGLDYMTTYTWSVTEVNDNAVPGTHVGDVWTFNTPEFGIVDDFESYSGDDGQEVYMTWFDGFGGDAALGGSTTGHIDSPFVETGIVNSGSQSMPVYIDNDGGFFDIDGTMSAPNYSEVVRELTLLQDWTAGGLKTLSLMFRGSSGLSGQLYCKIGNTKVLYDGEAANLGIAAWQAWNIDLSSVGGNLTNVRELAIGVDGGTSGVLYIDDIRLYPKTGETIIPVEPDTANLIAHYTFDEGSGAQAIDASGQGNHAVINGGALYVAGVDGTAIELDGTDDYVGTEKQLLNNLGQFTIACWLKGDLSAADRVGLVGQNDCVEYGFNTANNLQIWTPGGGSLNAAWPYDGAEWHHILTVGDGSSLTIYLDGYPVATGGSVTQSYGSSTFNVNIGGGGVFDALGNAFAGQLDDVRIYDRALSAGEALWLSGNTKPIHMPF